MQKEYRCPDVATSTVTEHDGKLLLIRRGTEPFKGKLAFPGGFVDYGEKVEDAAIRETKEETGINVKLKEILTVNSDPKRDPRKHIIDIVFVAEFLGGEPKISKESIEVLWIPENELRKENFAFDHSKTLENFFMWKKSGGTYWSGK